MHTQHYMDRMHTQHYIDRMHTQHDMHMIQTTDYSAAADAANPDKTLDGNCTTP